MGGPNKLLQEVDGAPLVRHAAAAAVESQAEPVVVVTGHQADAVRAVLGDLDAACVHNPDYAEGLSTSLKAGLDALPEEVDGVVVLLGDMPAVTAETVDRLIAAFDPPGGAAICMPERDGRRGNPVLLARRFFPELREIAGDIGAKPVIAEYPELVRGVPVEADVFTDLDTPEALAAYRGDP
jgi:molybdenum cofactor cytidylyltransferase